MAERRRSLMPALIVVVAMVILLWSQWSSRQEKAAVAGFVESMVDRICLEETPVQGVRWADSIIRDSVVTSIRQLCSSSMDALSAAVIDDPSVEGLLEVRITADSKTAMTLQVERLASGDLLVRGWSSE